MFGFVSCSQDSQITSRPIIYYCENGEGDGKKELNPGSYENFVCNTNWWHWRVYVDLDRRRSNAYLWNAGVSQPTGGETWENANATRKVENTVYFFRHKMTETTGGIAGISFSTVRSNSGVDADFNIANAPCFDNLQIAWKAKDGADYTSGTYESFYVNDFKTRRVRTLQPAGMTTAEYPRDVGVSARDTFTPNQGATVNTNRNELSNFTRLVLTGNRRSPEPPGIDNWRRISDQDAGSSSAAAMIDSATANGGNMLRISGRSTFMVLGQLIGATVTNGKVRVSADVRLPNKWYHSDRRVCLALGSRQHWTTTDKTATDMGYGAIMGKDNDNQFYPSVLPQTGTLASNIDLTKSCLPTNWYRMVVTADLDAKTYDYTLLKADNSTPAGTIDRTDMTNVVYSVTGIGFRNPITELSAFSLWSYGGGNSWYEFILWDNIRVWKDWNQATQDGTLLYENNFNTRYRSIERERTPLVEGGNRCVGVDGWMQWRRIDGAAWIMGTNRMVSFKCPWGTEFFAAQSIGTKITRGKVRVNVDMRPPDVWYGQNVQTRFMVYAGGDLLVQGNECRSDAFYQHNALQFGFGNGASGALSLNRDYNFPN